MSDEFPIDVDGLDEDSLRLLNQIRAKDDVETGARTLRDLSKLKVSEAVELIRLLRTAADFGKEPPSQSNIVARKLFKVFNEKLGNIVPELPRLMEEEALLAEARDAAQRVADQNSAEMSHVGRPWVYCGVTLALYVACLAVGNIAVACVGGLLVLWAFGRSTWCRSCRAAAYVKLANMLSTPRQRT